MRTGNERKRKVTQEYDKVCNPCSSYEDCKDFFDPFNYIGNSDSESFFDDEESDSESVFDDDDDESCEDEKNLKGLEDVNREPLEEEEEEEEGDETSELMLKLPLDIFLDILSRQPIWSLARCRCVCKTWHKIVHHPHFTSMHIHKSIHLHNNHHWDSSINLALNTGSYGVVYCLEHDMSDNNPDNAMIVESKFVPSNFEFEVVGSCNGLLCLSDNSYYHPIYVCNPAMGEYVKIPESRGTNFNPISGFGYVESAKEYKVIRMIPDSTYYASEDNTFSKLEVEIYTLGSGMWRKLGDVSFPLHVTSPSVFVNGALHWLTDEYIGLSVSERIISFDVSREEFHAVPPPPVFDHVSETFHFSLCDLRKSLCLLDYSSNDQFEIWVMKKYGVKTSWAKDYIISRQVLGMDKLNIYPLKLLPNGELLLYDNESLICYDPEQRIVRKIGIHNLPRRFEAVIHVGSFVSLSDIIGPATSRRSVNNGKWYTALRPLHSHNPEVDTDDCILDYEVHRLATLFDSGVALSDLYPDGYSDA